MENRKLVAILACRNHSSRLFAKPLQSLATSKYICIIEYLIKILKKKKVIQNIVLAVSENDRFSVYNQIAKKNKVSILFGNEKNVLLRTIKAANLVKASDILRVTSESPFPYLNNLDSAWLEHLKGNYNASFLDNVIDGCGYEIINLKTLKSIKNKTSKFQNEHITNYIRLNKNKFSIKYISYPAFMNRKDIRLTVDNPEDLVLCREVYKIIKNSVSHKKIISFLDKNEYLKKLVKKYLHKGYASMYL